MRTSRDVAPVPGPPKRFGRCVLSSRHMRKAAVTIIFIVLMICLVGAALWGFVGSSKKPSPEAHFESLDDMMRWLAAEAVSMAGDNQGIVLDYSEKSIEDVEKILGTIHDEYKASRKEKGIMGLAMAYGAYIGEAIRRVNPDSKWEVDHAVAGEKSYPLSWLGGEIFPCGWCYKRIIYGPMDNVWHKYLMSKQERTDN